MSVQNDQWETQAAANAETIEGEIEALSSGHWDWFQRQYKDFWGQAKQISDLFKSLKPLKKEDRERLWEKFNAACEEAKRTQNKERRDREYKSNELYKDLLVLIESARVNTFFGFDLPDVEEMRRLGGILREAGEMLSENKQHMLGEHKQECFERIQAIRREHDAWWKALKGERNRRFEEFQQRVRANLERNYERHRKASDALSSCREHADQLRSDIASAWNDDWACRAEGWLAELEDKIRDIENSISQIEEWIREDEEKLR